MEEFENDNIGLIGLGDGVARDIASIWWVYLPSDADRDVYINSCFRTGTVTLINNNNEIVHKVPVGKMMINFIDFPPRILEDGVQTKVGSPVLCLIIPRHEVPFVIDIYNADDEFEHIIEENQWRVFKKEGENSAEITLKGKDGKIILTVDSDQTDGGQVLLNITNSDETAKLGITVNGEIDIVNTGTTKVTSSKSVEIVIDDGNEDGDKTSLKYEATVGLTYTDEFGNQLTVTDGKWDIVPNPDADTPTINLGSGAEKIILGDAWAQFMNDFITEVAASTVASTGGPLLNSVQISAFITQLNGLLSNVSSTD